MFPTISFWLYLLFIFNFNQKTSGSSTLGNQTDNLTLIKLKESISIDPNGFLNSWNKSTHFCNWQGITCDDKHQRVTILNLHSHQLHGTLSPHVGNLSFLRKLNLVNNSFFGKIPQELGRLLQLQHLSLSNNSFAGEIPTNLTNCANLEGLYLINNNLIGKIPIEIGSLEKLQILSVSGNDLIGGVPPVIGNLSSLTEFAVSFNNLEGDIPQEICLLKNLTTIIVGVNNLSGTFPSCLYNMSLLTMISAAANHFHGSLPPSMFHTIPNLLKVSIGGNQISGPIPTSIENASTLAYFDISQNHFVGQVPSLGKPKDIWRLNLEDNNLGYNSTKDLEFLKSLTNCSKLQGVSIASNNFGGSLPNSLGNLSTQISRLYLGDNQISGKIPSELGNLNGLILLTMENNHFEGIIPATFGKFKNMQKLDLGRNKLSGDIPTFIGNLSQLFYLHLGGNKLEGNIPPSIGNCQKLQYLIISQNNFRGIIPLVIFSLSSLTNLLDLSQNSFSGNLPIEVGMLKNIGHMDLSENLLSDDIPDTIGECISLEYLSLQGNSFHGTIPSSLASLKGLQYVDLSRNQLSGPIPNALKNISSLEHLNISFNMLEGEVPIEGVFGNASRVALIGNNKLCGGISELNLTLCPDKGMKSSNHHNIMLIAVIVCSVSFLIIFLVILTICWMRKINKKPSSDSPTIDQLPKISYQELHQATDGFSISNLIGSGSFGSVYNGYLVSEDKVVAIKVLNLQKKGAHRSFIAECNALKNIRHRNLVKILTCCSSIDNKGQEFKALVYEYMKNGSLEQWLHPDEGSVEIPILLDLDQRLNIFIDVASSIHYLHHECGQLILHCDIKPSNILLDNDMVAHVSDFGIAKLVSTIDSTSQKETSSIGIKGTVGYAPPEYGTGSEVSTYGDMYSFGMLMLETLTGRRPTNEMFEDGLNLQRFVEISYPNNLLQILDPNLVLRNEEAAIEDENQRNLIPIVEKCLVSLVRIGLACSVESPKERMNIVDVARELSMIKKTFITGIHTRE